MKCNICGTTSFIDMKVRIAVKCAKCGSLERTRLMYLYIQRMKIKKEHKILHIAPERSIYNLLKKKVDKGNYVVGDINLEKYFWLDNIIKVDLCDLDDFPSLHYDLIIHSHVLEHTPCNIAYTLFHLHRMLTENGLHFCVIPFMDGWYDECFKDIGDDERKRRFGQHDHVRLFGNKDIPLHLGKLINMPDYYDVTEDFAVEELRAANIPEDHWRGFHIGTILKLKKYDMKLLCPPEQPSSLSERLKIAFNFKGDKAEHKSLN